MCPIPEEQASAQRWTLVEGRQRFRLHALVLDDETRHAAYQRLRARIFYEQLGWQVTVTPDGREVDRYDTRADGSLVIYTLFRLSRRQPVLLGGIRISTLHTWEDAMVMQEMHEAGLFPDAVTRELQAQVPASSLLEVTRLCLDRRHPLLTRDPAQRAVAQELLIAGVYRVAEQTGRTQVLAVVSTGYARILEHLHFVLHPYYTHQPHHKTGYVLAIIDLAASVRAMQQREQRDRVRRVLSLCYDARWIEP